MTTVAYRNGAMAGDRRCTFGGSVDFAMTKVFRRADGALIGGCGSAALMQSYCKWFIAGEQGAPPPMAADGTNAEFLVAYPDGRLENRTPIGTIDPVSTYAAIGTGRAYALAAMDMGADAERAVEIACLRDTASGNGIDVIQIDEHAWIADARSVN